MPGQDFAVDFSDVQEWTLVPAGWYDVEVTDGRVGQSTNGNAMLTLELTIRGGEQDGRKIFDNLMLVGDGRGRTKTIFRTLLGDEAAESGGHFNIDDFIGAMSSVRVTHRIWREEDGGDGEPRTRVSRYREFGGDADFEDFVAADLEDGSNGDTADDDEDFFG